MKVRKLLELQSKIEEKKIPCDLCDDELNQHYSLSKDKAIDILDMDLIHLIRSYNKTLSHRDEYPDEDVYDCISDIEKMTKRLRKLL